MHMGKDDWQFYYTEFIVVSCDLVLSNRQSSLEEWYIISVDMW